MEPQTFTANPTEYAKIATRTTFRCCIFGGLLLTISGIMALSESHIGLLCFQVITGPITILLGPYIRWDLSRSIAKTPRTITIDLTGVRTTGLLNRAIAWADVNRLSSKIDFTCWKLRSKSRPYIDPVVIYPTAYPKEARDLLECGLATMALT